MTHFIFYDSLLTEKAIKWRSFTFHKAHNETLFFFLFKTGDGRRGKESYTRIKFPKTLTRVARYKLFTFWIHDIFFFLFLILFDLCTRNYPLDNFRKLLDLVAFACSFFHYLKWAVVKLVSWKFMKSNQKYVNNVIILSIPSSTCRLALPL
jgi:hypothetical protein